MTTTAPPRQRPRTTGRPVPRWAVIAAHVAALTPVLSSLWRLPLMFGIAMGMDDAFMDDMMSHPLWARAAYLVGLGMLSDGLAFLTIGLVRPWGEVFPRWVPVLCGRRIPVLAVVVPAVIGGLAATMVFTVAGPLGWPGNFDGVDGWTVMMTACYAPLVLWGPLVLAVTFSYWRRRRA
ncbi:hypothetical protein [Solicola gregarius]|uniref:Uncharacterized protein n=1 Tax=Solicola gregarius TaxID=2908642 RepID=A0AA46YJG4_9ACTN|nr:hypothetical protein [Solicola gregarius]UYM04515.1 hypothetical protein L0C25_18560 [Solicola gregarius]